MGNILIADDNLSISSILGEYAKKEGFTVFTAVDGVDTLNKFNENEFEIILLDVMMPKKDGFQVCREIREKSNVPIIMITARGEDFERIMGLDIGADDYIVKPFSPGEVMARIRAILRRISPTTNSLDESNCKEFSFDNLHINLTNFTAQINENPISLTKKELEILWTLANNPNKVFTRDSLLNSLWGYDYFGDNRTVDSHIKRLRSKLDLYEHNSWIIKTIWGVGYKFEVLQNEK